MSLKLINLDHFVKYLETRITVNKFWIKYIQCVTCTFYILNLNLIEDSWRELNIVEDLDQIGEHLILISLSSLSEHKVMEIVSLNLNSTSHDLKRRYIEDIRGDLAIIESYKISSHYKLYRSSPDIKLLQYLKYGIKRCNEVHQSSTHCYIVNFCSTGILM